MFVRIVPLQSFIATPKVLGSIKATTIVTRGVGQLVAQNNLDSLNELFKKIISLPGRAKTMKDLGEALRAMVALEREAFSLDDEAKKQSADPLAALLHGIANGVSSAFKPVVRDPDHDGD